MSKQHPNQDYYKIGGSSQSDGPDRNHANATAETEQAGRNVPNRNEDHPAIRRAKRK